MSESRAFRQVASFKHALIGSAIAAAFLSIVFHDWLLVSAAILCTLLMGVGVPGLKRQDLSSGVLTGSILGLGIGLIFLLFGPVDFYG